MTPKDDPCKVCLCDESWSGETDDKDFCYNIDCGLGYQNSDKLKKGQFMACNSELVLPQV